MRQSSGRWFLGSQACWALRCEKMRSLARDFSSSRRAPPIAASYLPAFERLAQRLRLHDVGVARRAVVERVDVVAPAPRDWCGRAARNRARRAMRSRKAIISLNFHVVSMWSSGNGMRLGKKALRARCSRTEESLPIEYIITGRSKLAATSRKISMLSDSRALRCESVRSPAAWIPMSGVLRAGRNTMFPAPEQVAEIARKGERFRGLRAIGQARGVVAVARPMRIACGGVGTRRKSIPERSANPAVRRRFAGRALVRVGTGH